MSKKLFDDIIKSQNYFRVNIRNLNNLQTFKLNWNSKRGLFGSNDRCVQFIDTMAASEWYKCYHEVHSMTKTDS